MPLLLKKDFPVAELLVLKSKQLGIRLLIYQLVVFLMQQTY